MKNNSPDNEIDSAFRSTIESMESEPSDKFWEESERNIALNSGKISSRNAARWKTISITLIFLLGMSALYIGYLHLGINKHSTVANENQQKEITAATNKNEPSSVETSTIKNTNPVVASNSTSPVSETQSNLSTTEIVNGKNNTASNSEKLSGKNNGTFSAPQHFTSDPDLNGKSNSTATQLPAASPTESPIEKPSMGNVSPSETVHDVVQTPTTIISDTTHKILSHQVELPVGNKAAVSEYLTSNELDSLPSQHSNESSGNLIPPIVSPFFISAFYSPTLINRKSIFNNNINNNSFPENLNGSETENYSYNLGLKFGIDLGARWTIRTGATYSHSSYCLSPKSFQNPNAGSETSYLIPTSSGTVNFLSESDSLTLNNSSYQKLSYVNVPLLLNYNFGRNKFGFFVSGGLNANLLVQGESELSITNEDQEEQLLNDNIQGLRKFTPGYSAGFGVNYMLSKHILITAEPIFSGTFQSINKNTPYLTHTYLFGCETGLVYHF